MTFIFRMVPAMNDVINKVFFKELLCCDPADVIQRVGADYNPVARQYRLKVWGCNYCVSLDQGLVRAEGFEIKGCGQYMHLFIIHYLMKAMKMPLSGQWVSEKDLKGGAAFFRGPHTLPAWKIAKAFDNDAAAFSKACEALGGRDIAMADRGFSFEITPMIPVAVLFWQGDEDFDSQAGLLFDPTIEQQLPLDVIYALAVDVCNAISHG